MRKAPLVDLCYIEALTGIPQVIKKCREVHQRIKEMWTLSVRNIIHKLNQILVGYFHYYGITDNFDSLNDFCYKVRRSLFFWLNRGNQRKSYNWNGFNDLLQKFPQAHPRMYVSIYDNC